MTLSQPPGILRLIRGGSHPAAAPDTALFLLVGDATAGPIREIVPDPGVTLPGPPPLSPGAALRLTLLHFSDLHSHLAEVSATGCRPVFSRMVHRMREMRRRCEADPNAALLVLSGGDDLVGTVFDELLLGEGAMHAAYHLYSAAGVDASVIGNHDLDLGLPTLLSAVERHARFPVLSANLVISEPSQLASPAVSGHAAGHPVYPGALFVLRGIRVGVLGLTTPAELVHGDAGSFRVADPIQTVHNLLPALRPLCDVLIVLSHLGYSLSTASAVVEGAGDVELARSLPPGTVHLIVGAHTHQVMNEWGLSAEHIVNGIPIVQAGAGGRYLGEVQLAVRRDCAAVTHAQLHRVADLPADEAFEAEQVLPLAEQVRALLVRPIGRVADHADLATTNVRENFASEESALANFIADALAERCRRAGYAVDGVLVDASIVPTGLPLRDLLTFGDLFHLLPYADTIALVRLTAAQLRNLLNDNARRADRPDEPHTERGFCHFSREVRYDLALGAARRDARAVDVTIDGSGLEVGAGGEGRSLLIACSSFVRKLAGCWERYAAEEGLPLWHLRALTLQNTGLLLRKEMLAYIEEHGGVIEGAGLRRDGRVRFKS